MVSFYGITLTVCYILGVYYGRKDIFSPRFLYNSFAWLKNVPYFMEYAVTENVSSSTIDSYFLYKFAAFLCVNLGITLLQSKSKSFGFTYKEKRHSSVKFYLGIGILVSFIGFLIKIYTILSSGGVFYILANIQARKELMAGQYYNELLSNSLLTCGVLLSFLYYLKSKSKLGLITFIVISGFTIFGLVIFGARRPALMLILQILMLYHFVKNRITIRSLFNWKSLLCVVLLFFYVLMMPMLRESKNNDLVDNPTEWVEGATENSNTIFREFSYCDGDLFAFDYFSKNSFWYGQSYLNIPLQIIPKSMFPNKPPMDDGMYLLNLMYGAQVTPNMPTDDLTYQTSVPFTLESSLYSNFGLLGIIIGCIIVGCLYQLTYKILIDTRCPIIMLLIYQEIMFVFVPSVLHGTSTLIIIVIYNILLYPLLRYRFRMITGKSYINYKHKKFLRYQNAMRKIR